MGGVIINLNTDEALERYRTCGAYSTRLSRRDSSPRGWRPAGEGTIADYLSIKEGDLVFFFRNRFIYGLGRIVSLAGAERPVLCNYPKAWDLRQAYTAEVLWDNEPGAIEHHPFVVFFEPAPCWYEQGIDMDEALTADEHGYVRMLPFFANVSFIRVDDFEAAHLASLIQAANPSGQALCSEHETWHGRAECVFGARQQDHELDVDSLVRQYSDNKRVRHEALLEAWIGDALAHRWELVSPAFGRDESWSFVGRQVPASPFKPPDYIDKIDVLAYDIEPSAVGLDVPAVRAYTVIELKSGRASEEHLLQTMKYVDWIAHRRQGSEYQGITAFLIACDFAESVREQVAGEMGRRTYIRPRRPYGMAEWQRLELIQYKLCPAGPAIELVPIP